MHALIYGVNLDLRSDVLAIQFYAQVSRMNSDFLIRCVMLACRAYCNVAGYTPHSTHSSALIPSPLWRIKFENWKKNCFYNHNLIFAWNKWTIKISIHGNIQAKFLLPEFFDTNWVSHTTFFLQFSLMQHCNQWPANIHCIRNK